MNDWLGVPQHPVLVTCDGEVFVVEIAFDLLFERKHLLYRHCLCCKLDRVPKCDLSRSTCLAPSPYRVVNVYKRI